MLLLAPFGYSAAKYGTYTQSQIILHHNNLCHQTVPFLLSFGWPVFQCIQNIAFEKLLIRHSHLYWVTGWAMLTIPEEKNGRVILQWDLQRRIKNLGQ